MYTRFTYQKPKSARQEENKPAQAVALGYNPEKDPAPRVLASGQGALAEQIIAVARANGILVREDPLLAGLLAEVAIDTLIPPELYALVAEVLAYVYRVQNRR
jgi:flagellar biosynthesis protein